MSRLPRRRWVSGRPRSTKRSRTHATREAFGQPIGNFQAIQFQLADLATDLEAARMLMWRAADLRGSRCRASRWPAAMAKLQASEAAHRAADRAMQILASAGYRRGSTIERLFRDVRAAEIYQGTSEVQRMIIAEQWTIAWICDLGSAI